MPLQGGEVSPGVGAGVVMTTSWGLPQSERGAATLLAMGRQKAWSEGVRTVLLEEGPQAEAPGGDGVSGRARPLPGSPLQHKAQTGAAVRGDGTVAVWCPVVGPPLLSAMRATAPPVSPTVCPGDCPERCVCDGVERPWSVWTSSCFPRGVPKL